MTRLIDCCINRRTHNHPKSLQFTVCSWEAAAALHELLLLSPQQHKKIQTKTQELSFATTCNKQTKAVQRAERWRWKRMNGVLL
jgi:hypothetical protein